MEETRKRRGETTRRREETLTMFIRLQEPAQHYDVEANAGIFPIPRRERQDRGVLPYNETGLGTEYNVRRYFVCDDDISIEDSFDVNFRRCKDFFPLSSRAKRFGVITVEPEQRRAAKSVREKST